MRILQVRQCREDGISDPQVVSQPLNKDMEDFPKCWYGLYSVTDGVLDHLYDFDDSMNIDSALMVQLALDDIVASTFVRGGVTLVMKYDDELREKIAEMDELEFTDSDLQEALHFGHEFGQIFKHLKSESSFREND